MKNYNYLVEFDNEKCIFNDHKYCLQVGICENCEYYPKNQSSIQMDNEQLSMFEEVKYERKHRCKK